MNKELPMTCNNKLCKKCIIKVIGQGGRCPYCRRDMLGKIVDGLDWKECGIVRVFE